MPALIMALARAASLLAICRIHEKGNGPISISTVAAAACVSLSFLLFQISLVVRGRGLAARIAGDGRIFAKKNGGFFVFCC